MPGLGSYCRRSPCRMIDIVRRTSGVATAANSIDTTGMANRISGDTPQKLLEAYVKATVPDGLSATLPLGLLQDCPSSGRNQEVAKRTSTVCLTSRTR